MQGFLKLKVQSYASQKLLLLTLFLFFTSQTFYAFGQDEEVDEPIRFTLDRQTGVFIDINSIYNSDIVLVELQKLSFQEYRTEIKYKVFPEGYNNVFQVTLIQQIPGGLNFTTTIPQSKDKSDRYQNLFDEFFPWLAYCKVPYSYDPTSSLPNNKPRPDSKKESIFIRCQNSSFLQITVAPPYNYDEFSMNQFELHLYMVQLSDATNTYTPIDLMPDGKKIVYQDFFDQSVQEPSTLKWPIQPYNNKTYFYNFYYLEQLGDWYENMRFFTAAINTSQVFCIARQGEAPTVLGKENIYTLTSKGIWAVNFTSYELEQLSKKKESPGQIEIIQLSTKRSNKGQNIAFVTLACKTRENAIDPYITIRGDVSILEYKNKPDSQKNLQFKNVTLETDVQNKVGLQKSDYFMTYLIDYNSTLILRQPQNINKTIQDIALNQLQFQLHYFTNDTVINTNDKYQMRFCRIASYSHINFTDYDDEGRWSATYETFESSATLLRPSQCEPYTTGKLQLSNIQDGLFTITVTAQQGQEKVYPYNITIAKQFNQILDQQLRLVEIDTQMQFYYQKIDQNQKYLKFILNGYQDSNSRQLATVQDVAEEKEIPVTVYICSCWDFFNLSKIDQVNCSYRVYYYGGHTFDAKTDTLWISNNTDWLCADCEIIVTINNTNRDQTFLGQISIQATSKIDEDAPEDVGNNEYPNTKQPLPQWAWYAIYGSVGGAVILASIIGYVIRIRQIKNRYKIERQKLIDEVEVSDY